MAGKSIPMGKMRPPEMPYLTVRNGQWTWRVLKAYVSDPNQPFARVHAAVDTPFSGGTQYGDTYWVDIRGQVVDIDPEVPESALPSHLAGPAKEYWGSVNEIDREGQALAKDGLF